MTAGSVGASAAPMSPDTVQEVERDVGGDGDQRGGAERADHAEGDDRPRGRTEPCKPHLRAALEQDHDQRERRDPLDVLEGQDPREPVGEVGGRGGEDEERARRRNRRGGRRSHGRRAPARGRRRRRGSAHRTRGGRPWGDLARRLGASAARPPGRGLHFPYAGLTPNPRAVPILRTRMRLALLTAVVLVLAVPAGWAASTPAGSLSVEDARGTVVLKGKGIVIGRLERGEVEIVDLSPLDQWSPRINGVPRGDARCGRAARTSTSTFPAAATRSRCAARDSRSPPAARARDARPAAPTPTAPPARSPSGDAPVPLPSRPGRVDFGSAVAAPAARRRSTP